LNITVFSELGTLTVLLLVSMGPLTESWNQVRSLSREVRSEPPDYTILTGIQNIAVQKVPEKRGLDHKWP